MLFNIVLSNGWSFENMVRSNYWKALSETLTDKEM